ncbi:MAG: signal recognition particle-docking protein FtsY, partial [Buchnera aphidicola]|nr:signal recognition particle-docking protein FtsY [Buchnera aphidicola]MDE5286138.1 signal recognition particle-docking protein FtsY [Buchnera aphidicola]
CNGQNSLKQIKNFHEHLNVTGIIMTKLDGTAKGGIIFSLADRFSIPIRYIGVGEKMNDLSTFNSQNFINAIFHK